VPGYTWSWVAASGSTLPPGLDLTPGGHLDGTPTLAGSYHVVVTVNDAQVPPAQTSANFTMVVDNPPPPSINTDPPPSAGAVNLSYAFTFWARGFTPFTWSERGALPPGLAFGTDGKLEGTPTALGSYPISVTVTDGAGQESATDDVTIEVFPHGFKATASMNSSRSSHRATLLNDGRVLVTGGANTGGTVLATAEIYNPAIGRFATIGAMKVAHAYHTATLLNNGKVLVTGGVDSSGLPSPTAELFDPATGTFALTSNMGASRTGHTATLLSNGKVLVTGGLSDTAELFDPTTGTFTATGKMGAVRTSHTATLLANGKVLVTGGMDANVSPLATADLYDPATGSFTSTGSMATARSGHTATLLLDGRVLVAGGLDGATAELFDPVSGTFGPTGSMRTARNSHTAVLLADGTTLVTGGYEHPETGPALALAEIFNETGGSFAGTGSLITGRSVHTATRLLNGQVLVTGGVDISGGVLATAELYQ
jgi:Galactose oxidase, central domain